MRPEALTTAAMAGDDSTHIRQALTYVIPAATIIDFYTESDSTPTDVVRQFYGEDTVAEVYEQRDIPA